MNTVVFRDGKSVGHNTDWCGFVYSFTRNLINAKSDHILLMGADGAGSAVAYGMLDAGAGKLTVFEPDQGRLDALVERMDRLFGPGRAVPGTDLDAAMAEADGVINATTIGMTGHRAGSCVPAGLFRPDMWVADCVYLPVETQLILDGKAAGCRTLTGVAMAVEQAVEAFRIFTDVEPDAEYAYQAIDQLLGAKPRGDRERPGSRARDLARTKADTLEVGHRASQFPTADFRNLAFRRLGHSSH